MINVTIRMSVYRAFLSFSIQYRVEIYGIMQLATFG